MSLRNKVRIAILVVILLWFLSHALLVGVGNFPEAWELWTLLLAVVIGLGVANLITRRAVSQYRSAVAREDLQAAKRQYETLRDFWRRRGSETVKSYGINLLILEGHYRDALEQLRVLDVGRIGTKGHPVITAQIGWCLAQMGEPGEALELVQPVLQQLESMGPDYASNGNLVLGVCYFLLGKAGEALRYFEKAKSTTSPSRKSTVFFYLGETYTALGDTRAASLAYQRAHEALPSGRFGAKALVLCPGNTFT